MVKRYFDRINEKLTKAEKLTDLIDKNLSKSVKKAA